MQKLTSVVGLAHEEARGRRELCALHLLDLRKVVLLETAGSLTQMLQAQDELLCVQHIMTENAKNSQNP